MQHRTSDRPSRLAEILGRATKLDIQEAKTGDRPVGGGVYIAPTDLHLLITQSRRVALSGARGIIDVKAAGGTVLAQDKATSLAFAMPHAAIATGCVDEVPPIGEIGPQLIRLVDGEDSTRVSANDA